MTLQKKICTQSQCWADQEVSAHAGTYFFNASGCRNIVGVIIPMGRPAAHSSATGFNPAPSAGGAKDSSMSRTEASNRTWAARCLNSPFKGEGIWHMKYFPPPSLIWAPATVSICYFFLWCTAAASDNVALVFALHLIFTPLPPASAPRLCLFLGFCFALGLFWVLFFFFFFLALARSSGDWRVECSLWEAKLRSEASRHQTKSFRQVVWNNGNTEEFGSQNNRIQTKKRSPKKMCVHLPATLLGAVSSG